METAIFWDFDGTLVLSNQSFLQSLQKACNSYGYAVEENVCRQFLHSACSWNRPEISYPDKTGSAWWDSLLERTMSFCKALGIPAADRAPICTSFREHVIHFPYTLYGDAKEILAYTKENGYKNYLLSNNFPELFQTVSDLGLDVFLEDCFLSAAIGYEKPRIEIFRYALEKAGNPGNAYMIGDNPVADIAGAVNAGMHTILVHSKFHANQVDSVCSTLGEVKKILSGN